MTVSHTEKNNPEFCPEAGLRLFLALGVMAMFLCFGSVAFITVFSSVGEFSQNS